MSGQLQRVLDGMDRGSLPSFTLGHSLTADDLAMMGDDGDTLLHHIVRKKMTADFTTMMGYEKARLTRDQMTMEGKDGQTVLGLMCQHDQIDNIPKMLSKDTPLKAEDFLGIDRVGQRSLIQWCAMMHKLDVVQPLLGEGEGFSAQDITAKDPTHKSVFTRASQRRGQFQPLCKMLKAGEKISTDMLLEGEPGARNLHAVMWQGGLKEDQLDGKLNLTQEILQEKSRFDDETLVHFAARSGGLTLLAAHLAQGVSITREDLQVVNAKGRTPLQLSYEGGSLPDIVTLSQKQGEKITYHDILKGSEKMRPDERRALYGDPDGKKLKNLHEAGLVNMKTLSFHKAFMSDSDEAQEVLNNVRKELRQSLTVAKKGVGLVPPRKER